MDNQKDEFPSHSGHKRASIRSTLKSVEQDPDNIKLQEPVPTRRIKKRKVPPFTVVETATKAELNPDRSAKVETPPFTEIPEDLKKEIEQEKKRMGR